MNRAPRVLHIVPALFTATDGVVGGAEYYALELARHMAEEVPTRLVTFGDRERIETSGRLSVRVIGNPWQVRGQRNNPFSLALLGELLKADVVHCHQQHILASSFAAASCRITGRRVFVTDHGGGGFDVSGYVSTDRWYHGHLHVSEFSRKIAGEAKGRNAYVILGGVDIDRFSPDESVRRNATALFVGRLLPHKGVDVLIAALPAGMRLEIIGQPYDPRYCDELKRLARDKEVVFRHDCDDRALVAAYRRALCVVLPSVYRTMYGLETKAPELLGQTLLEGMACATPVVCTNVGGMPELVEDGVTGLVVVPNDPGTLGAALSRLAENPDEAVRMGRKGRLRVIEKFTWRHVVRRCLQIYAQTAGSFSSQERSTTGGIPVDPT